MKRFIFSVLTVAVFFLGIGALVEKTGARIKSDEKALDLVRKARIAIGGDAAIGNIQSLRIVGKTTLTTKVGGTDRSQTGDTEIAFQFPDKMMKSVKIGNGEASDAHQIINKQVDVVVVGKDNDNMKVMVKGEGHGEGTGIGSDRKIVIKKDDGTVQELTGAEADKFIATEHAGMNGEHKIIIKKDDGSTQELNTATGDKMIMRKGDGGAATMKVDGGHGVMLKREAGDKTVAFTHDMAGEHHEAMRHNDLLRLALGLLITPPAGLDVDYTFGGEGDLEGTACNIVVASFGGQSFKLFLDRSSNLPAGMAYTGVKMPQMITFTRSAAPPPAGGDKDVMFFTRSAGNPGEMAEFQVRFSDYRAVNGVQLPYKWTQTVGGASDETFEVTNYEVNPANIGDAFGADKVMVRTSKKDNK